jgi:Domain of unknown function (DUF2383)
MENYEAIKVLSDLCQLDMDTVGAYDTALKHINDSQIHMQFSQFSRDHIQHFYDLNALITTYGGQPSQSLPNTNGVTHSLGLLSVLQAIESNEITTNSVYKATLENYPDLPVAAIDLLLKNLNDEIVHLAYLQKIIPIVKAANREEMPN